MDLKIVFKKNCVHNSSVKNDIVPLIGGRFGKFHKTLYLGHLRAFIHLVCICLNKFGKVP